MESTHKAPSLKDLNLFDSCVTLGRIVHSYHHDHPTAKSLLDMMDRYEIAEAMVHDHYARITPPREDGNRRLLEEVAVSERLHPVWVIEPTKTPGREAAKKLVERMFDNGVYGARLLMKFAPPMAWLWEDILRELDEYHIPCFLDFGDGVSTAGNLSDPDLSGLREIALTYPALPLILSNVVGGLGIHPGILPLMRRTKSLYLDNTGVLEYFREAARDVGPDRVVFATGTPFTDPGIYISNIQYTPGLSPEAKRLICGDNLRRLLSEVRR